jgi:methionyl-tRNA formyltransferase
MLAGQRFKILRAVAAEPQQTLSSFDQSSQAGSFQVTKKKLLLRVSDAWIELLEVQPAGKKPMAGLDWARGHLRQGVIVE